MREARSIVINWLKFPNALFLIFCFVALTLFSNFASAVDTVSLSRRLTELGKQITAKMQEAQRQSDEAKKLRNEHGRLAVSVDRIDPATGEVDFASVLNPKERAAFYSRLSKMRTDASVLETDSRRLGAEVDTLVAEEQALVRQVLKAKDDAEAAQRAAAADQARRERERLAAEKKAHDALILAVDTMAVTQSFSSLQAIVNDNDRVLDQLERKYDKSLLGAYVKDKMRTLMNDSGSFCKATTNCNRSADSKVPIEDSDLDRVFPFSNSEERPSSRRGKTGR